MPFIDPSVAEQGGDFEPGVYLAEVADAELRRTRSKGEENFNVKLTIDGKLLAYDTLMLEGKGARFGIPKLRAMGFFQGNKAEEVQSGQLIGKRIWVRVAWQEYEGKKSLKPVSVFQPTFDCGYYPESRPPTDAADPVFMPDNDADSASKNSQRVDDSTPF